MSTIYLMIPVTLLIAGGFLLAYIWSVRNGQFEDTTTPAMRMLSDDKPVSLQIGTTDAGRTLPLPVGREEGRGEGQRLPATRESKSNPQIHHDAPHPHSLSPSDGEREASSTSLEFPNHELTAHNKHKPK